MSVRRAPDARYPGKPWLLEAYAGGRRTRRRFATRAEANAADTALQDRPPERGLEEALLRYIEEDVPRLREGRQVIVHARSIREPIRGRTFADIPDVVTAIKAGAAGKSTATLNRRLALLRRICRLAEEWGWIPHAPRVRLLPESTRETWVTPEQVEDLASRMPRAGDIVRLAALTGLRRRELLELRREHVRGRALVVETLKQRERRVRLVPVPDRGVQLLAGIPWMVTNQILRTEWEAARRAAGLPELRFHDLRHHYASRLVEAGLSDRVVMELLGHTDPRLLRRYAHLREEHLAELVSGL